ncbi:MAG: dephospho-CoA kinase [Clostridiales bacterium]|jgi:dephospho-CoA kinase|nr:dephospho-CoA kinase [Clostridiales bacterium]
MIVGITGRTGSGKTAAAKVFESYGAYMIDADKLGHKALLKTGTAYNEVVEAFGPGILAPDGEIYRKVLGRIVFSDAAKLTLLNRITHKHIARYIAEEISDAAFSPIKYKNAVLDAVLLYESGVYRFCNAVIAVVSGADKRRERIIARDGLCTEAANRRISIQEENNIDASKLADFLLENDGSYEDFIDQTKKLAEALFG